MKAAQFVLPLPSPLWNGEVIYTPPFSCAFFWCRLIFLRSGPACKSRSRTALSPHRLPCPCGPSLQSPDPPSCPRAGLCRRRDSLRNVLWAWRQPRGYALRVSSHEAFARLCLPRPSPRGPAPGPRPPPAGDAALGEGRAGRTWRPRPVPRRSPHLQREDVVPAAGVCSGVGGNRRLF